MVQVRVSEGLLEGEVVQNEYGGSFCSFKGIPYAQPPLGELRFKAPQPAKPWTGVRQAKNFGRICPQFDYFIKEFEAGSEDCLYINVYTPDVNPKSPLPVMVWIHGGGFIWGSGDDDMYGPDFLVRQGVILVTFNYRLEVIGFLCLNTKEVPGNAGMKDQVAALRWVKKNIKSFGGDPDNVTIFGESAGAASVSYHLISPMSKGLFKRAIVQSGSSTSSWAQAFEPRRKAIALAKKLGCHSDDDEELSKFFKAQPVEKLVRAYVPITFTEATKLYVNLNFTVVSEKQFGDEERFFYGDVKEAFQNGIHEGVEVMAGYVLNESLVMFSMIQKVDEMLEQANTFYQYFVPQPIALKYPIQKQLEIGQKIKEFYVGKKKITRENMDLFLKFIDAELFKHDMNSVQKLIARKNKVYFYKFSCVSKRNMFKHIFGVEQIVGDKDVVSHCDDLAYLFPINIRPQKIKLDSKEFQMIDRVTSLWTNFAKHGNPTPDMSLGAKWLPFTVENQEYLDIGEKLTPLTKPDEEEIKFWENIYKEYPVD